MLSLLVFLAYSLERQEVTDANLGTVVKISGTGELQLTDDDYKKNSIVIEGSDPDGIMLIAGAFSGSHEIVGLKLAGNIKINENAFADSISIKDLYICIQTDKHQELTKIPDIFTSLNFPIENGGEKYPLTASFENHRKLTTVNLESISELPDNAFKDCVSLTMYTEAYLTKLGAYAFYNTNIDSSPSPDNLQQIGDYCFANCPRLELLSFYSPSACEVGSNITGNMRKFRELYLCDTWTYKDDSFNFDFVSMFNYIYFSKMEQPLQFSFVITDFALVVLSETGELLRDGFTSLNILNTILIQTNNDLIIPRLFGTLKTVKYFCVFQNFNIVELPFVSAPCL